MGETEISWTHQLGTVGRTWNPVQGCRRISPGCENCYAERLAARFAESGWSQGLINLKTRKWNGVARLASHKLDEPLRWRKPATVFVNSMSDLFFDGFSNEQIAAVFGVMAACSQHTFQILTKRAKRMREWFEWLEEEVRDQIDPDETRAECRAWILAQHAADVMADGSDRSHEEWLDRFTDEHRDSWARDGADGGTEWSMPWPLPNVWLGTSVENQDAADERIPELLRTPAAIRFLSCEPLIGPVHIQRALRCPTCGYAPSDVREHLDHHLCKGPGPRLSWVIAGCESGPGARPCDVEWLRSLRDQCSGASVPYFLKQAVENIGRCGDADNPNGDRPCGERITSYVYGRGHASYSCACCVEGSEDGDSPDLGFGDGSKRKAGGVVELPYLDGVQHAAFPEVRR